MTGVPFKRQKDSQLFVIIFGSVTRPKNLGQVQSNCRHCGETPHKRVLHKRWFTLFTAPIFPYSTLTDTRICSQCGSRTVSAPSNEGWIPLGRRREPAT